MVRKIEQPTHQAPPLATCDNDVWTFGFVVNEEDADALIPPDVRKTQGARTATIRKLLNEVNIEVGVGKPIFLCVANNRSPEFMARATSETTELLARTLKLNMEDGLWLSWELAPGLI
ncbi:hypothetical protein MKEN_00520600 [Mycena kentingensis (nom. inval.)]|nr:hypothetical protein MKEN_00520600 [Mycena kentingensis (nom. inval.)]